MPKIEFNKALHLYRVDKILTPSVSAVLDVIFGSFEDNIPEVARDKAINKMHLGSQVHACIAWMDTNNKFNDQIDYDNMPGSQDIPIKFTRKDVEPYLKAWDIFKQEYKKQLETENIILDIKTGQPTPVNHNGNSRDEFQLIAYYAALELPKKRNTVLVETVQYHPVHKYCGTIDRVYYNTSKPSKLWNVYLKPDGSYKVKEWEYSNDKFNLFLAGLLVLKNRG